MKYWGNVMIHLHADTMSLEGTLGDFSAFEFTERPKLWFTFTPIIASLHNLDEYVLVGPSLQPMKKVSTQIN